MSATDPLSVLLGQKKEQAKASSTATAAVSAIGSAGSKAAEQFTDVCSALGRRASEQVAEALGRSRAPPATSGTSLSLAGSGGYPTLGVEVGPSAGSQTSLGQQLGASSGAGSSSGPTFDDLVAAEKVHVNVKKCFFMVVNPLCEVHGRLLVTNFRLKFQTPKGTLREDLKWMQEAKYFDLPMGLIEDVKEEKSTTVAGMPELKLKVHTKDFRTLSFLLTREDESRCVLDAVAAFSTPGNPTLLFAFKHAEEYWANKSSAQDTDGWHIYDPSQEYARMGISTEMIPSPGSPWQVSNINSDYSLCSTYPAVLALPRRMADQELRAVAGFRKRGRLPAMSWCGGPELQYASLWRCSQTTEGLMGQKCPEDQKMVDSIRRGAGNPQNERDLLVIDLRPWKSAWVNKAGGGGFEGYPRCRLVFGGIDNIHAVREAFKAMGAAVLAVVEGEVGTWIKDVANSSWYDYMGGILHSTNRIVKEILEQRCSVMVHCSDGWDRTAQTASLAMLCLDSHYRTQAGFLKLIQKEWCSFGHLFRTRLALGETPSAEYSPVFIQWLECVFQLCTQFPTAFEFAPSGLLRLAHEVYTNRYGTFLCDSERERTQKVMPFAISLWSVMLRPGEVETWRNPNYECSREPLIPSECQANYVIWEAFWYKYHQRGQKGKAAASAQPSQDVGFGKVCSKAEQQPATCPQIEKALADFPSLTPGPLAPPKVEEQRPPPERPTTTNYSAVPASAFTLGDTSLFSPSELNAARKKPAPKQVFGADDDEEDIFAKPRRSMPSSKPAVQAPPPAPADVDDADAFLL